MWSCAGDELIRFLIFVNLLVVDSPKWDLHAQRCLEMTSPFMTYRLSLDSTKVFRRARIDRSEKKISVGPTSILWRPCVNPVSAKCRTTRRIWCINTIQVLSMSIYLTCTLIRVNLLCYSILYMRLNSKSMKILPTHRHIHNSIETVTYKMMMENHNVHISHVFAWMKHLFAAKERNIYY